MWYRQKEGNIGSLRRVEFFWICRDAPSFGWFQSLLRAVEVAQVDREPPRCLMRLLLIRVAANFLRINVYLTQKIDEDMLWNIAVNDVGAEYDPLTLLRTRTMFGRPNWNSVYRRIQEAIEMGGYLPGSSAQLRTKVGVRLISLSQTVVHDVSSDILLWTWSSCQSH